MLYELLHNSLLDFLVRTLSVLEIYWRFVFSAIKIILASRDSIFESLDWCFHYKMMSQDQMTGDL